MARSLAKVIVHFVCSLGPPRWGYGSLWQRYPGLRKRSQSSHLPGHPACWVAWADIGLCLRHGRSLGAFTNKTPAQPAECSTLHSTCGNIAFPGGGHAPTRERLRRKIDSRKIDGRKSKRSLVGRATALNQHVSQIQPVPQPLHKVADWSESVKTSSFAATLRSRGARADP